MCVLVVPSFCLLSFVLLNQCTPIKLLSNDTHISEVGGVSAPSTPANREIVSFRSCVRAKQCDWRMLLASGRPEFSAFPPFPFPFSSQHLFPFPFEKFENDVKIL